MTDGFVLDFSGVGITFKIAIISYFKDINKKFRVNFHTQNLFTQNKIKQIFKYLFTVN